MRKVFSQLYSENNEIACWYGKPPKDVFRYDVIRLAIGKEDYFYLTPDEASTVIRALSAGITHYLVNKDKCAKAKGK